MDQKQTGSQPAFYHNKSKHTKALSVSALLRHPLPLQPPSLPLVLPPSLHPTPPSSVQLPPHPPSLFTAPPDAFPPFHSLPYFLYAVLSFCHPVFSPYTLALSLLPLHEDVPTPHSHTNTVFLFFWPTSYSCMSTSLPPTLLTLSLSQFSHRV